MRIGVILAMALGKSILEVIEAHKAIAAIVLAVVVLLCSAASAQDIEVIRWEQVKRPGKVVLVERYFPLNRLLFGKYRVVVVPKVEEPKK